MSDNKELVGRAGDDQTAGQQGKGVLSAAGMMGVVQVHAEVGLNWGTCTLLSGPAAPIGTCPWRSPPQACGGCSPCLLYEAAWVHGVWTLTCAYRSVVDRPLFPKQHQLQ
jgi:hypothetical protein